MAERKPKARATAESTTVSPTGSAITSSNGPFRDFEVSIVRPEVVAEAQGAVRHLRRIRLLPRVTAMINYLDSLTSE